MLTNYLKLFISLVLIISAASSCEQTSNKDLIVGKWQFEKFISEYEGSELTAGEKNMIKNANDQNNGLVMSFSKDNQFKSEQKGGMEVNNSTGQYALLPGNRIVIMGDTININRLDNVYLRMSHKGRPTVVFKKI